MFRSIRSAFILVPKFHQQRLISSAPLTRVSENDGVRSIVLDNEKTRNSLSLAMMESLIDNITENQFDTSLRCIVLSSTGKVFSAGHNLKELTAEKGKEYHEVVFNRAKDLMFSIIKSPVPVIAKVDGLAAAAGCQLIATCDIVVCSDRSSFSTPGASFGIFCSTPGIAVSRVVPRMKASYMVLTGLPLSAQEAVAAGLVTEAVPADKLDGRVQEICDAIKHKSRSVVSLGKKFFNAQLEMDLESAYSVGGPTMVRNLAMKDGQEGINSFVEKRKAQWSHKEEY